MLDQERFVKDVHGCLTLIMLQIYAGDDGERPEIEKDTLIAYIHEMADMIEQEHPGYKD